MPEPVSDRVVVITGASAGVGRAAARAFAATGARLGLLARGADRLEAARAECEAAGVQALAVSLDVADGEAVESAADRIERELGPIDVWVNNAMTSVFSPVAEMTASEYRRVTEVTYLGAVHGTLAALRRMRPRDRGTIVQVGSALAYRAIPLQSAYCAAKHALNGFTESLRCELLHDGSGVHVTSVNLPALNTPQFGWVRSRLPNKAQPVPPIYQPEVAARAIVWASEQRRREVNVGWPTYLSVYGDRIAPAAADHYLASTGYDAQQTNEPEDPSRPDNLYTPVDLDVAAHGAFDDRATYDSWALWATMHRGWLIAAGAAGAALLVARRRSDGGRTQPRRPPAM